MPLGRRCRSEMDAGTLPPGASIVVHWAWWAAHFGLALACERTGQRSRALGHVKLAIAMRPGVEHYERALERIAG